MTMDENFYSIIAYVLNVEGGLADVKGDPGGRTNYGVTQSTLNDARSRFPELNLPATVDALTRAQTLSLYYRVFYLACGCNALSYPLALSLMDAAVNAGLSNAVAFAQRATRLSVDGIMGPHTLAAINASNAVEFLIEFNAQRNYHDVQLNSTESQFELGWSRRVIRTHTLSVQALKSV